MRHAAAHRPRRTVREIAAGLAAAAALVAAVAGLPVLLYLVAGIPIPHHVPSPGQITHALTSHDNGQLFLAALLLLAWAGWAVFTASVAVEAAAQMRRRAAVRLPGCAMSQHLAGALVAAVAVLLITAPPQLAHPAPTGPSALLGRLGNSAVATAMTAATSGPPGDGNGVAPGVGRPPPSAPAEHLPSYEVRRGDTLWDIAERHLGDPERWQEIARLNYHRRQPDGRTLTDSHWIYPGWILLLPAGATHLPATHLPAPHRAGTAAASRPGPSPGAEAPDTVTGTPAPPPSHLPSPSEGTGPAHPPSPRPATLRPATPRLAVTLPDGGLVAAGFATGISAALAAARLHARRRRTPADPAPGTGRGDPLLTPTISQLHRAHREQQERARLAVPVDQAPPPLTTAGPRCPLRVVLAFDADGREQDIDLSHLGGLGLIGPGAPDTLRALTVAVLAAAPAGVRLIVTEAIVALLPGITDLANVTTLPGPEELARSLHRTVLARARLLDSYDTPSLTQLLAENPDESEPYLLVLSETTTGPEQRQPWMALLDQAEQRGVAAITLGAMPAGPTITVDGAGRAIETAGDAAAAFAGTRLIRISEHSAAETLTLLAAAQGKHSAAGIDDAAAPTEVAAPPLPGDNADEVSAPVSVALFGPLRILIGSRELDSGLRSKARELLAYLALHPAGVSDEQAIEDLWPEVDFDRARAQFRTAVGNLRAALRTATGRGDAKVVAHPADRYELDPTMFHVDVWTFQRALARARSAAAPPETRAAFVEAAHTYTGELLAGAPYGWAEPIREELRRPAVDTLVRLAELATADGDIDQALAWYEQAITADPYQEELYRRIMRAHARLAHPDAVRRTYRLLETRLGELDVDPDTDTQALLGELLRSGPSPPVRKPASPASPARRSPADAASATPRGGNPADRPRPARTVAPAPKPSR
ncbi:MAG: BTAD domain-containing putative transcriptional regulator [Mycobacteriales bacterium]